MAKGCESKTLRIYGSKVNMMAVRVVKSEIWYLTNNQFEVQHNGTRLLYGVIQYGIFMSCIFLRTHHHTINTTHSQADVTLLHGRLAIFSQGYLQVLVPHPFSMTPCSTFMLSKHHCVPLTGENVPMAFWMTGIVSSLVVHTFLYLMVDFRIWNWPMGSQN